MPDARTIELYDARAADYAAQFAPERNPRLVQFMALLETEARVLDLGCGPGQAAKRMAMAGLEVEAIDASAEMAAMADEHRGVSARCGSFESLDAVARYDGIWANFSLLHAPRSAMPDHLAAIACALKPGGWLALGLKLGEGEARDTLGRFYTYWKDAEISALLAEVGLFAISRDFGAGMSFDGVREPWIVLMAQKVAD